MAKTETYEARIKLKNSNGRSTTVIVEADCPQTAKKLIEMQYGKGCLMNVVSRIRK